MNTAAVAAVLAIGLTLVGCGPGDPVRFGFIGGLSGRGADLGESGRNGVTLAFEQRNAAGGIDGRALELIVRDDGQDEETAREATRGLIADGVSAVIGPMTSSMAAVVAPIAESAGVVVISPTATALEFSGKDDFFFRVNGTTREYAEAYARFHYDRTALRRIAIAYDQRNLVFTRSWLDEFDRAFSAHGGAVSAALPFDGESSFSGVMARMLESQPDGLLFIANAVDTAQFSQQARKFAPGLVKVAAEWAATEELLELGGKAVEGLYVVQSYNRNDDSPRYRAFHDAYVARFRQEPSFPAVAAFDAATILLAAVDRAGPDGSLRDALRTLGRVGVLQQVIELDRYGDTSRNRIFTVIRDNQFQIIE